MDNSKLTKNQKKRNKKKQATKAASNPSVEEETKEEEQVQVQEQVVEPTELPELVNPYKTAEAESQPEAVEEDKTQVADEASQVPASVAEDSQ